MPTAFNVIATLIAKPGQQATLETLLRGLLEPTRLEAGCEQYDLHQDLQHPGTLPSARSTRPAQLAQVMPLMGRSKVVDPFMGQSSKRSCP
jgi:hypothetical protein